MGAPGCCAARGMERRDTVRRPTRTLTTASVAISRVLSNSCRAATARMARSLECAPPDCADTSCSPQQHHQLARQPQQLWLLRRARGQDSQGRMRITAPAAWLHMRRCGRVIPPQAPGLKLRL